MSWAFRTAIAAIGALAASACSHLPQMPSMPEFPSIGGAPAATPGLAPRERVRLAVELLGDGEESRAEVELRAALEEQPNNGAARRLLEQITTQPGELLRGEARAYTVREGDTMSVLAERYQGDALLFYALARYNNLDAPNQLVAGQRLMIPQRPGVTVAAASVAPSEATPPPATVGAPAAAPTSRSPNAQRANQLRLQGLQQLNTGEVDAAVSLLRQAQALDSENPAIQRDLSRALRLQASLRGNGGSN